MKENLGFLFFLAVLFAPVPFYIYSAYKSHPIRQKSIINEYLRDFHDERSIQLRDLRRGLGGKVRNPYAWQDPWYVEPWFLTLVIGTILLAWKLISE